MIGAYTKNIWVMVGPLVGVMLGALLGRSWDQRKWLNDNRKEEYRELMTALTDAAAAIIERVHSRDGGHIPLIKERIAFMADKQELQAKSIKVLQDRIFIAAEIEQMDLLERWGNAVKIVLKDKNLSAFDDTFEVLKKEIVKHATTL